MAQLSNSRKENQVGSLFVDRSCINCGTCRILAGNLFQEVGGKSAVVRQPANTEEWINANRALVSCPTSSIGSVDKHPSELRKAIDGFPLLIEENVYYCGFAAASSYGASSYLIVRSGGNILVDSPRFNSQLVRKIEALGGVRYMFLTHRDDVADHDAFQKRFGCERIIHIDDVTADTQTVEIKISGHEQYVLADNLLAIPAPGHTEGHMVLLYRNKFLFTGDHLAFSPETGTLYAFDDACWFSWDRQIESVNLLKNYSFEWVLPGHGDRGHIKNSSDLIVRCTSEMRKIR